MVESIFVYSLNIVYSIIDIYKFKYNLKGCAFMAYDILVKEVKDLPEDMPFHRSVNPLAGELIAIAEDFDETPECFKEYI